MRKFLTGTMVAAAMILIVTIASAQEEGPAGPPKKTPRPDGPQAERQDRPNRPPMDDRYDSQRSWNHQRPNFDGKGHDGPHFQYGPCGPFPMMMRFMNENNEIEIDRVVRFLNRVDIDDNGLISQEEIKEAFEKMPCPFGGPQGMKAPYSGQKMPPRPEGFWREGDRPSRSMEFDGPHGHGQAMKPNKGDGPRFDGEKGNRPDAKREKKERRPKPENAGPDSPDSPDAPPAFEPEAEAIAPPPAE